MEKTLLDWGRMKVTNVQMHCMAWTESEFVDVWGCVCLLLCADGKDICAYILCVYGDCISRGMLRNCFLPRYVECFCICCFWLWTVKQKVLRRKTKSGLERKWKQRHRSSGSFLKVKHWTLEAEPCFCYTLWVVNQNTTILTKFPNTQQAPVSAGMNDICCYTYQWEDQVIARSDTSMHFHAVITVR